jgi:hypothetical protein
MKRNQWIAGLFALLLFACGAVVGALGQRYYASTVVSAKTSEDFRHRYVSEMQSRLKLSAAQLNQLEAILDDTKSKYKAVRDGYRPAMLRIKNEQVSRVKSILTPQQIPGYQQLINEREQRAREQDERERREDQRRAAAHKAQAGQ